jgi:hypothetical protein
LGRSWLLLRDKLRFVYPLRAVSATSAFTSGAAAGTAHRRALSFRPPSTLLTPAFHC